MQPSLLFISQRRWTFRTFWENVLSAALELYRAQLGLQPGNVAFSFQLKVQILSPAPGKEDRRGRGRRKQVSTSEPSSFRSRVQCLYDLGASLPNSTSARKVPPPPTATDLPWNMLKSGLLQCQCCALFVLLLPRVLTAIIYFLLCYAYNPRQRKKDRKKERNGGFP